MRKAPVSQQAKMRPLLSIQETKMLRAEGVLNQRVKGPKKTYEKGVPHSIRQLEQSDKYHARLLTGRQSAAKTTDQLNPDRVMTRNRANRGVNIR
jgi:hypothetical protein